MYPVSNDFKAAILKNARAHKLKGYVDGVAFDGDDVLLGTFEVKNQLCQATEISLGGVYIGELDIVFSDIFANAMNLRGSWRGVQITADVGVELLDHTFDYIPIPGGAYTVDSAEWTDAGLKITAYDNMVKFNKAYAEYQSSGYAYDFLLLICQECGVALGMTQLEVEALPNGTELMAIYPTGEVETYRDLLSQLATALCCFATYHNDNVGGLTLNIGTNVFLQYGTKETVMAMRQAVADGIEGFRATPFSATILPNPAYDLGDLIEFSGGIGQGSLGCIMSFVLRITSSVLEGYGENPALSDARSKTDKEISGLLQRQSENEVVIHTFENAQAFTLGDEEEVEIIDIRFATVSPKVVNIWHEIELDVTANDPDGIVACQAIYYLNEELIAYSPVTTWNNDGLHLLHLLYFIKELLGGTVYEWQVYLKMIGGTATIARGDIHASLYGQGLVASDTWDGYLDASDNIVAYFDGGLSVNFTGNVSFTDYPVQNITASDTVSAIFGGGLSVALSETVPITKTMAWGYWTDEDDNVITDENGDGIVFIGVE